MRLAVELYGQQIGTLEGDSRSFDFHPRTEAIEAFGANSAVLSVAIPLAARQRRDFAARRRNWFAELLPEGTIHNYMLAQSGLRAGDTLGFLARYGRDVAGALQVWDLDDPSEPRTPRMVQVDDATIRALLDDPISAPLANDPLAGRSSLGGVQPKVVLARHGNTWNQGLGGYPTTHILKPQLTGPHASVIYDEEYGSRIARRLGLSHFDTSIEQFDGLPALVIERYDRDGTERVHQEDFNQVLGASRDEKYQEIGGRVSLARVADTLVRFTPPEDLNRFARLVILTVAVGNLDMHAKNLSLLHLPDGDVRLADAYDVVPQSHMAAGGRLAMAVNGLYHHGSITKADLVLECESWGLRRASVLVDDTLEEIALVVADADPLPGAFDGLKESIARCVTNLRDGHAAGH